MKGPCERCKGSGIDPEHTAAETYGTGDVRGLEEPCAACQLTLEATADSAAQALDNGLDDLFRRLGPPQA